MALDGLLFSELDDGLEDEDNLLVHDDDTAPDRVSRASLNKQLDGLERLRKESSFREATGEEPPSAQDDDMRWAYALTSTPAESNVASIGAIEERGSGIVTAAERTAAVEQTTAGERAAVVVSVAAVPPDIAQLTAEARLSSYASKFADQNRMIRALKDQIEERDCTIASLTAAAASNRGDSDAPREMSQKSNSTTSRSLSFVLPTSHSEPMKKEEGERLWLRTEAKILEQQSKLNITVAVRVRPFTQREIALQTENCIEMHSENEDNQQCWITDPKRVSAGPTTFRFDYCFQSFNASAPNFADQEHVFYSVGIDILAKAWSGFHACLFAYGQTGSGKTHSVMGSGSTYGVLPRLCEALFYFIDRSDNTEAFKVDATYIEVYVSFTKIACGPMLEMLLVAISEL